MTATSVVKDSTGKVYPFETWRNMYWQGHEIKAVNPANPNTEFVITKLSEEALEKKLSALPKPRESSYFKTNEKVANFTATDLDGKSINLKDLEGKIVVVNFWFINCAPCRIEMPELNALVDSFKNDKIVFIAVALDKQNDLQKFLQTTSFKYRIVGDGGNIAAQYGVGSYPTHLILDKKGKAVFHTSGLAMNTIYWLKKAIKEQL